MSRSFVDAVTTASIATDALRASAHPALARGISDPMMKQAENFSSFTPDCVLNALESLGLRCDGRLLALNSYENRVYQAGMEEGAPLVASTVPIHNSLAISLTSPKSPSLPETWTSVAWH